MKRKARMMSKGHSIRCARADPFGELNQLATTGASVRTPSTPFLISGSCGTAHFTRLFKAMGIATTPAVLHYLRVIEKTRFKRHEKRKLPEQKKIRVKRQMEALKQETRLVIKGRARGDATYLSGVNMAEGTVDGYTAEDMAFFEATKNPKQKKRKVDPNIVCKHCGLKGHSLTRSKHCLKNPANLAANQAPLQPNSSDAPDNDVADNELLEIDAAADVDAMDSMPFVDDIQSDDDATTDDEEDITRYQI
jgi:hypothetical protein